MVVHSKMKILSVSYSMPVFPLNLLLLNIYNSEMPDFCSDTRWPWGCQYGKCRTQYQWQPIFYLHCQGNSFCCYYNQSSIFIISLIFFTSSCIGTPAMQIVQVAQKPILQGMGTCDVNLKSGFPDSCFSILKFGACTAILLQHACICLYEDFMKKHTIQII